MAKKNELVYLHLKPEHFLGELSLREWDSGAAVERRPGNVYITTTLDRHSVLDLRFNCGGRTRWHKSCPGVSSGEYGRETLSEILDRADVFTLVWILDRMFYRDLSTSELGRDYLRLRRSVLERSVSCGGSERSERDGGFDIILADGRRFFLPLHEEYPLPANLEEDFDEDLYESFIVSAYLYVKCGVESIHDLLGNGKERD